MIILNIWSKKKNRIFNISFLYKLIIWLKKEPLTKILKKFDGLVTLDQLIEIHLFIKKNFRY